MFSRSVLFATFCFWGAFIAFFPVISIMISENAYSNSALNSFLKANREVMLSIGTLLLISLLAIIQVYIGNRSAELREVINRRTQTEIKLADFRRDWIVEMRDDAAELVSIAYGDKPHEKTERMQFIFSRIQMRMDPQQTEAMEMAKVIASFFSAMKDKKDLVRATTDFQAHVAALLDQEWTSMKGKLNHAQATEITP